MVFLDFLQKERPLYSKICTESIMCLAEKTFLLVYVWLETEAKWRLDMSSLLYIKITNLLKLHSLHIEMYILSTMLET